MSALGISIDLPPTGELEIGDGSSPTECQMAEGDASAPELFWHRLALLRNIAAAGPSRRSAATSPALRCSGGNVLVGSSIAICCCSAVDNIGDPGYPSVASGDAARRDQDLGRGWLRPAPDMAGGCRPRHHRPAPCRGGLRVATH